MKLKTTIKRDRRKKRLLNRKIRAASQDGLRIESGLEVELTAAQSEDGSTATPRFTMVAYSGAPMKPGGWSESEPLVLDLAGMEAPKSQMVPIHRDHDTGKVLGHTTSIVAKNQLTLSGVISAVNEHAAEVVGSSKNKFPWQSSVGASLIGSPELIGAETSVNVNGRRMHGPIYVARKWRLFEASFVSLGADSNTSAVAAGMEQYSMTDFDKWVQASGFDPTNLSDTQTTTLQAAFDALNSDENEPETAVATQTSAFNGGSVAASYVQGQSVTSQPTDEEIMQHHRTMRAAELRREALIQAKLGKYPEIQAKAIEEGWGNDRIELEALRASAAKAPAAHVVSGDRPENAIEAAMFIANGLGGKDAAVKHYGEQAVVHAERKLPRAAGVQFLIHEFLRANGRYTHPGTFDDDTIRAALRLDQQITAGGGFSTVSLSGTLSNLAGKTLLQAYEAVPTVTNEFCRKTSHSDFKSHTRYRVTTMGLLEKLGPAGEIKHTNAEEDTYTNQVETYARMMALTRQMMRNDDLGAFLMIPAAFGRMAAETHERSVFEVLLNNTDNFFTTTPAAGAGYNANALAAGAGSALSGTSLGSAEQLFWNQVDRDGRPVNLKPSVLLVSNAKYRDAVNLVTQTTMAVVGDPASVEQLRVSNEYLGEFRVARSSYITNTTLTGNSSTQWWLLASPSLDVAVIEIAYLDGRQTPVIESSDTDFNTLGMQWRSYMDWGVAKQDPRAGVRSPGA